MSECKHHFPRPVSGYINKWMKNVGVPVYRTQKIQCGTSTNGTHNQAGGAGSYVQLNDKVIDQNGHTTSTDAFQTNSLLLNGDSLRPVAYLRLCKQACLMCSQAGLLVAINKHLQSHKSH